MINGSLLRDAILSAAYTLASRKQSVDELNVFPVPDGDTGTNMSMTIGAAARELEMLKEPAVSETSKVTASALLRGARGNSGVILSLLFRGISKGLQGKSEASGTDLADALVEGVSAAYKAVMKPTEGTILTVSREASEKARSVAMDDNDALTVFRAAVSQARETLARTPEMLPVLKKAGVVDAGGQGLVIILQAMLDVFEGGPVMKPEATPAGGSAAKPKRSAVAEADGDILFTYCTEFIVLKAPGCEDALKLRAYLESIGDSVVVVDDEEIIKVHVHTNHPGDALESGLKFGMLTKLKIENMKEQHTAQVTEAEQMAENDSYVPVDPDIPYGFVAVAAGMGVQSLFEDLGVNNVVTGGQTMNPSTDDILNAIHATPAQTVFVLPNNKNIIMAAEQAVKLADRRVCVLQTVTIPQGISAMLAFDPEASFADNQVNMTEAASRVQSGQITFAARDSDYDGHNIKAGEILAMENGKLAFVEKDLEKAVYKLTRSMVRRDSSFVTLIYGSDVTDGQAESACEFIKSKLSPNLEISLINGGQPVYYYLISVE
ncbi:MAG TPA: DAK2 domain-containing protein [Candidatus Merdivicinus excrementipullorum]|uniref:DAK2 domain-containing protein n=1 Tax=Candidatus Merdivicinus excrementipullorum TaxID=2840867 RepID=A0A9D1K082_9FIRM|nr:DAK2 domain-containing protein [Candidatus Merdivicinus excrementipullorum]